jgi:hypothetical protein
MQPAYGVLEERIGDVTGVESAAKAAAARQ